MPGHSGMTGFADPGIAAGLAQCDLVPSLGGWSGQGGDCHQEAAGKAGEGQDDQGDACQDQEADKHQCDGWPGDGECAECDGACRKDQDRAAAHGFWRAFLGWCAALRASCHGWRACDWGADGFAPGADDDAASALAPATPAPATPAPAAQAVLPRLSVYLRAAGEPCGGQAAELVIVNHDAPEDGPLVVPVPFKCLVPLGADALRLEGEVRRHGLA